MKIEMGLSARVSIGTLESAINPFPLTGMIHLERDELEVNVVRKRAH